MRIEVGKSYRARDGRKVNIVQFDTKTPAFPILGVFAEKQNATPLNWTVNGAWHDIDDEDPLDLIEEWTDEPPRTACATPGMSLRDYFAAHAMVALMDKNMIVAYETAYKCGKLQTQVPQSIADHAYMFADAMIARSTQDK